MTWCGPCGPCGVSAIDASSVDDSRAPVGRSHTTAFPSRFDRDRGTPHVKARKLAGTSSLIADDPMKRFFAETEGSLRRVSDRLDFEKQRVAVLDAGRRQ